MNTVAELMLTSRQTLTVKAEHSFDKPPKEENAPPVWHESCSIFGSVTRRSIDDATNSEVPLRAYHVHLRRHDHRSAATVSARGTARNNRRHRTRFHRWSCSRRDRALAKARPER